MPKRVEDVRLRMDLVRLAFSEKGSEGLGSSRDESLLSRRVGDGTLEPVDVGVRLKVRRGLGCRRVEGSSAMTKNKDTGRFCTPCQWNMGINRVVSHQLVRWLMIIHMDDNLKALAANWVKQANIIAWTRNVISRHAV